MPKWTARSKKFNKDKKGFKRYLSEICVFEATAWKGLNAITYD